MTAPRPRRGHLHALPSPPLEGEVLPPERPGWAVYGDAEPVERWPVILEGEVAEPATPERWHCPECGHEFDRDPVARSAYCLGGHRGEHRHALAECLPRP